MSHCKPIVEIRVSGPRRFIAPPQDSIKIWLVAKFEVLELRPQCLRYKHGLLGGALRSIGPQIETEQACPSGCIEEAAQISDCLRLNRKACISGPRARWRRRNRSGLLRMALPPGSIRGVSPQPQYTTRRQALKKGDQILIRFRKKRWIGELLHFIGEPHEILRNSRQRHPRP